MRTPGNLFLSKYHNPNSEVSYAIFIHQLDSMDFKIGYPDFLENSTRVNEYYKQVCTCKNCKIHETIFRCSILTFTLFHHSHMCTCKLLSHSYMPLGCPVDAKFAAWSMSIHTWIFHLCFPFISTAKMVAYWNVTQVLLLQVLIIFFISCLFSLISVNLTVTFKSTWTGYSTKYGIW